MLENKLCVSKKYFVRSFTSIYFIAVCAVSPDDLYGQTPDADDLKVSTTVQELIDATEACLRTYNVDCARASLNNFTVNSLNELELYRYWLLQGRVVFFEGNFPEAIETFRKIADLARNPRARVDYKRYIAQLYASMGQFQQAYDTLEEIMVEDGLVPLGKRHLTNDALWLGFDIYATGNWDLVELVPNPPEFPLEAKELGLQNGYVNLEFTVTLNGTTRDVKVVESSHRVFEESAIKAARNFKYKPRLEAGKPVETVISYRLDFLSGSSE